MSGAIDNVIRTKANFDELQRGERLINEALADLELAQSCGIECDQLRDFAKQVLDRTARLKAAYFKSPPTR